MAKLIDADALCEAIKQRIAKNLETYPNSVNYGLQGTLVDIEDLPDASEPILAEAIALRARVEQLEAQLVCKLCACEVVVMSDEEAQSLTAKHKEPSHD